MGRGKGIFHGRISVQLTRSRVIEKNSAGALPDRTDESSVTKSEVTPEQKSEQCNKKTEY